MACILYNSNAPEYGLIIRNTDTGVITKFPMAYILRNIVNIMFVIPPRSNDDDPRASSRVTVWDSLDRIREAARMSTIWASRLSDMRLCRTERDAIIKEMDDLAGMLDVFRADALIQWQPDPKGGIIYQDIHMSKFFNPDTDSYS